MPRKFDVIFHNTYHPLCIILLIKSGQDDFLKFQNRAEARGCEQNEKFSSNQSDRNKQFSKVYNARNREVYTSQIKLSSFGRKIKSFHLQHRHLRMQNTMITEEYKINMQIIRLAF